MINRSINKTQNRKVSRKWLPLSVGVTNFVDSLNEIQIEKTRLKYLVQTEMHIKFRLVKVMERNQMADLVTRIILK
jgi:hypothetical protein